MITKYHAKLFKTDITLKHPSDSKEKFINSLSRARISTMPHQINAALFAFKSPLSKGAILADEVGLGKTIEAGIILSQFWAENKKKILIISPSSLRQQWKSELHDRFFLDSIIMDSIGFQSYKDSKVFNPFNEEKIIICSPQFAKNYEAYISEISWDLVIIDEAHKLRNVYKKNNILGKSIREATKDAKTLLLTATPIQNNLSELFGLTSFIDPYLFGDINSFKNNYKSIIDVDEMNDLKSKEAFEDIKERLKPLMIRTLREDVSEYIKYTSRLSITQRFDPTQEEHDLYLKISKYLQKDNLHGLPSSQRKLITLIIRKLLASSTFAVSHTLRGIEKRLQAKISNRKYGYSVKDFFNEVEDFRDTVEEWDETSEEQDEINIIQTSIKDLEDEVGEVRSYAELAESITENSKGIALINALIKAFSKLKELGANQKALIFTESKRTQEYLFKILSENGYKDQIVLFNGDNNSNENKQIYYQWLENNKGKGNYSGSPEIDKRTAIVDHFKNNSKIMIATEAGSEGLNMQFCSLVVNYDLPWNPQRVEQRIGRCHRYGQKHDVIVVNFLNQKNLAEQRILDLLEKKFKLFDGVFGSSNNVLGTIASGFDLERTWNEILQKARSEEEIEEWYQKILALNEDKNIKNLQKATDNFKTHFDIEVVDRLLIDGINRTQKRLLKLIEFYFKEKFKQNNNLINNFELQQTGIYDGNYTLDPNDVTRKFIDLDSEIVGKIFSKIDKESYEESNIEFLLSEHQENIEILKSLRNKSGFFKISKVQIESLQQEEYLLATGKTIDSIELSQDQIMRLFNLDAIVNTFSGITEVDRNYLKIREDEKKQDLLKKIETKNQVYFREYHIKLQKWFEDRVSMEELELKKLKIQKKTLERDIIGIVDTNEFLLKQEELKKISKKLRNKRIEIEEIEEEIEAERDKLIEEVKSKLQEKINQEELFTVSFSVL